MENRFGQPNASVTPENTILVSLYKVLVLLSWYPMIGLGVIWDDSWLWQLSGVSSLADSWFWQLPRISCLWLIHDYDNYLESLISDRFLIVTTIWNLTSLITLCTINWNSLLDTSPTLSHTFTFKMVLKKKTSLH